MTIPFAAGTGTILRGVADDGYGDEKDTDVVVAQRVVGAVREVADRVQVRTDQPGGREDRRYVLRVPGWVDIREGDRWRDEVSQVTYWVDSVTATANPVTGQVRVCRLRTVGLSG